MHTSPYPSVPPLPEANAHSIFFGRPDQKAWSNYTLYIDADSGRKTTVQEFGSKVRDGMTALGTPITDGGLGLRGEDGEIIGIMSDNSSDYSLLVHSLLAITVPFALISAFSTKFELAHAIRLSTVTRLFVHARLLPHVLPVAKEAGLSSRKIYILGGHVKGRKSLADMIDHVRKAKMPRIDVRPARKDTLAYLVFSSGTSGLPKAVMISHGNIMFAITQASIVTKATAEVYKPPPYQTAEGIPVSLAFLPMHHSYGLHAFCFRAFISPATYVILPQWSLETALRVITKYHISNLVLIPSVMHQFVNSPKTRKADLSSVRVISSGAAYLPPELSAKMAGLAPRDTIFTDGYGMSEATIAAISQPFPGALGGLLQRVPLSTGVLLPSMEARILRDDGTDAGFDEAGELCLRGGNICTGYWNNEKANKDTFVDGWLRTGDRFTVNKDGYFFFADRTKDTLKVSGSQVSPMEIENVLLAHPDKLITDASVAGVSGGRTSDEKVPRAWVVLSAEGKKRGAAAAIKELDTWQQENLSKYKWLRGGIEVVKEIPKSPTGKTLRRVLQERYEQRTKKLRGKL